MKTREEIEAKIKCLEYLYIRYSEMQKERLKDRMIQMQIHINLALQEVLNWVLDENTDNSVTKLHDNM